MNHKLKNIILEEKSKRKEYEHMYKIHNLEIKEKENNEYGYKNKESIMKLKYDIMLKENKEMKQELNLLKEKLAKTQMEKDSKKDDKTENKENIEINNDNINNSKIFLYQEQDIKESENENIEEEKSLKEKEKERNQNINDNQNNKNKEEIKIDNEELKLFKYDK